MISNPDPKPFTSKAVLQILVILVVLLAIVAGYYYTAYGLEMKKRLQLKAELELIQNQETTPILNNQKD